MLRAIYAIWIGLLLLWLLWSLRVKRVQRRAPPASRIVEVLVVVAGFWLMFARVFPFPWLETPLWNDGVAAGIAGLAVTIAGVAFAIWARYALGGNWSGQVTVKHDHELQRSGPYAIVRHPIYSGLLLALLGTAIVIGEIRGLIGVALAGIGWRLKSLTEERLMTEEFGAQYIDYKREVRALIPFLY